MTYVFVYGTLKRGYGNNQLLKNSRFVQEAVTQPFYRLYERGIPYLVKVDGEADRVIKGEVWEVDDATLANLDRLEGVPHHYKREEIHLADWPLSNSQGELLPNRTVFAYFYAGDVTHLRDCGTEWPRKPEPPSKEAIVLFRKAVDQKIALWKTIREIEELIGPTDLEEQIGNLAADHESGDDAHEAEIVDAIEDAQNY